jgi:hypothetical protein
MNNKSIFKALLVPQHSEIEKYMGDYDSTTNTWNYRSFDEIAKKFPDSLLTVTKDESPMWGNAFYIKGIDGKPVLHKENWDTSD